METETVGSSSESLRPSTCFVTGGGQLTNGDRFGGTAKTFLNRPVAGVWSHHTGDGDFLLCAITNLTCFANGGGGAGVPQSETNLATLEGDCAWNGEEGYALILFTADRGEPNTRDEYAITVVGPDGSIVYEAIDTLVAHGNYQIHAANPGHP